MFREFKPLKATSQAAQYVDDESGFKIAKALSEAGHSFRWRPTTYSGYEGTFGPMTRATLEVIVDGDWAKVGIDEWVVIEFDNFIMTYSDERFKQLYVNAADHADSNVVPQ